MYKNNSRDSCIWKDCSPLKLLTLSLKTWCHGITADFTCISAKGSGRRMNRGWKIWQGTSFAPASHRSGWFIFRWGNLQTIFYICQKAKSGRPQYILWLTFLNWSGFPGRYVHRMPQTKGLSNRWIPLQYMSYSIQLSYAEKSHKILWQLFNHLS